MSIFQIAEELMLLGSIWVLTVPDSKRRQSDSIRLPTKGVVAEVLPSLKGDEGADESESACILAFFGGGQTALGNEGGEWVGRWAQPLVEGGATHASSGLEAENML